MNSEWNRSSKKSENWHIFTLNCRLHVHVYVMYADLLSSNCDESNPVIWSVFPITTRTTNNESNQCIIYIYVHLTLASRRRDFIHISVFACILTRPRGPRQIMKFTENESMTLIHVSFVLP